MNNFYLYVFLFVLFFNCTPHKAPAQWNPDAGVIPSYTWTAGITTSSGGNGAEVNDHNDQTCWQSAAPLPYGFISKPNQNILHGLGAAGNYASSGSSNHQNATDANLGNSASVTGSGYVWFELLLNAPSPLISLSLKCSVNEPINIFAHHPNGDSTFIATWNSTDNFSWKRFNMNLSDVSSIKLSSATGFQIFEIAAIATPLTEFITLDFGQTKTIQWIESRHWAGGKASATKALGSLDKINWFQIAELDPNALRTVTTYLSQPVNTSYLKIEHTLIDVDYAKVFVWEVNAWNGYGPFGQMPAPTKSSYPVSEIIGINGIWGWGHDMYSGNIAPGKGPDKFNKIATHARNFHNMHWDITNPNITPDYSRMATSGTQALSWLNWDKEYKAWKDAGLKVTASILFTEKSMPHSIWNNPYSAGYNYGYSFARHFGPTNGNGLVETFEAGNEPWDYPASFYNEVVKGMVQGVKDGDPAMKVFTCALQSAFPHTESANGGNYMGARLPNQIAPLIDGLNVHHYSYANDVNGKRIGVHPEHIQSSVRALLNDLRFRDVNLPGKKIYVTEWGWDSEGAGEDCTHTECVSELEQAVYAVRGAMLFIRLGVDRLTWYFYSNGGGGLYSRSGLVGSSATNFSEKQSFRSFQAMMDKIENKYFLDVYQENDDAWVYRFGDANGKTTHLVAWKPVNGNDTSTTIVQLNIQHFADSVWQIAGHSPTGEPAQELTSFDEATKTLTLKVSAIPIIAKVLPDSLYGIVPDTTVSIFPVPASENYNVHYFPNPTSDGFNVSYHLEKESAVELSIFNSKGELVSQPLNKTLQQGDHLLKISGNDFSAGIYYCIFKAMNHLNQIAFTSKEKLVVVK